jgi:CubicO group peptidase (beta-lactamase class C family)
LPDYFEERPEGGQSASDLLISGVDEAWNLEKVVKRAKNDLAPKFPPEPIKQRQSGKKAYYADTNYQLLRAILEDVSGKALQNLFEELFFEPLELSSTYLFGYGGARMSGLRSPATIYYKDRALQVDKAMKSFGPDGGLVSNVVDSLKFISELMAGELFEQPTTLARMQSWRDIFFPFQYGLGLMRSKLPRILSPFAATPELIGHSGSTSAFLYYSDIGQLYIAGTLNQLENQGRPVRLMLKIIKMVSEAGVY